MWADHLALFAQRYRVISYDIRGHGQSIMPPIPYANHRDVRDLLRALGADTAYVLGHSMGGGIALNATLLYPEMVDALILVGSGIVGYAFSETVNERAEAMAAARRHGDVDEAIEIFLRLWTDGPRRSPQQVASTVRERVRAMARQTLAHPPAGGTPEPVAPPAIARLAEVRVPTLIVVGDQDWPDILAAADLLAGNITDARKVVIPQAAHMVSMERPEEFNRAVLDFLDKP